VTQLLILLAIAAGYGAFVMVFPSRPCRKCSGWGQKAGRRRRVAACGRCKGTGRTFRPGARLLHKGAGAAIRHLRERTEVGS
jgi:DnaJ-class molecular chaperone